MVSTHLKDISQIGTSPQVGVKINNVWVATTYCRLKHLRLGPIFLPRSMSSNVQKPCHPMLWKFLPRSPCPSFPGWGKGRDRRFEQPPKPSDFRRILKKKREDISYQSWLLVSRLKCSRLDLFLCLQVGFLIASRLLLQKNSQNKSIWKSQEILWRGMRRFGFARI